MLRQAMATVPSLWAEGSPCGAVSPHTSSAPAQRHTCSRLEGHPLRGRCQPPWLAVPPLPLSCSLGTGLLLPPPVQSSKARERSEGTGASSGTCCSVSPQPRGGRARPALRGQRPKRVGPGLQTPSQCWKGVAGPSGRAGANSPGGPGPWSAPPARHQRVGVHSPATSPGPGSGPHNGGTEGGREGHRHGRSPTLCPGEALS